MHVVATAGHVDHGKSTLVLALTGIDPDRFEEEKRRGLTIDLGFAWTTLPSGRGVAFVDVPGHVRFIKNMLAGVGAVDACLFVVAATEGWKPQSEEHLRILEILGVGRRRGRLTKVGAVDADEAELARLDVIDHVAGTFLERAELVLVDAPAGLGVDELRAALDRLLARTPTAADTIGPACGSTGPSPPPAPGTVVTGTLAGGRLRVGDELSVAAGRPTGPRPWAAEPAAGRSPSVGPGHRVAVNLVGVDHDDVGRGDALVRRDQWHATRRFDAILRVLGSLDHRVSRRGAYFGYSARASTRPAVRARCRRHRARRRTASSGCGCPSPCRCCPAIASCSARPVGARPSAAARCSTSTPSLPAARARPDRSVDRVVAERGWVDAAELERLTGERRAPSIGAWVVAPDVLAELEDQLRRRVDAAGSLGLDVSGLDERSRAVIVGLDGVVGRRRPGPDRRRRRPPRRTIPSSPPWPHRPMRRHRRPRPVSTRVEVRELVRRGLVVEQDGMFFAPSAVDAAGRVVASLLRERPEGEGVTVGELRDALGTSRKYILPLVNRLDATGVTRRRGDVRVAGPRLPAAGNSAGDEPGGAGSG